MNVGNVSGWSSWRQLVASKSNKVSRLKLELQHYKDSVDDLRGAVLDREAVVREREATVVERERQLAECQVEATRLGMIVAQLQEAKAAREAICTDLREVILAREAVVREREATIVQREQQLAECHAEAVRLSGIVAQLHNARDASETAISRYEISLKTLELRLERAQQEIDSLTTRGHQTSGADRVDATMSNGIYEDETMNKQTRLPQESVSELLAKWRKIAEANSRLTSRGGQAAIEPYIIEKFVYDRPSRLIISNVEAREWYDNNQSTEIYQLLRFNMIRWGDTVFDCGSNQGIMALNYAHLVGNHGRVIAFDPFPMNIEIGNFNAYLNGVNNIDFIQAGLSEAGSQLTVAVADQTTGAANDTSSDCVTIQLLPLDIFASYRPDFIKIDVEGAEVNVLQGATRILQDTPAIYIEIHPEFLPRFGRSAMEVFNYIDLKNYHCYIDHPGKPMFSEYFGEYDMTEGCALYFVPRSRGSVVRLS